jgi:hypothetical protein
MYKQFTHMFLHILIKIFNIMYLYRVNTQVHKDLKMFSEIGVYLGMKLNTYMIVCKYFLMDIFKYTFMYTHICTQI